MRNNLKQIGLALHNYMDVNDGLPPNSIYAYNGSGGRDHQRLVGQVHILPFIEQENLFRNIDSPSATTCGRHLVATGRRPISVPRRRTTGEPAPTRSTGKALAHQLRRQPGHLGGVDATSSTRCSDWRRCVPPNRGFRPGDLPTG